MKAVGYEWRLREVMASAGIYSTTKLIPLLKERGIELSSSQVYRLAAEKPERLNMHVFAALLDILDCSADDLVRRVDLGAVVGPGQATGTDTRAGQQGATALRDRGLRPKRAQIVPPHA
ncbi:helix-turn-helix domain-containing protein [Arthrobacter sp. A2-55]|uniref:helix-turn-helix domain-containing protein n=1 Tax=Arthrobacter sp. A2-55 TaxID=2897337 RepID=UPI0021CD6223|nr:helix-turn-helix transcriptional regulator [Arthrobacter sp. A2-55]MCU6479697.1 helix-turn-helix transcriptional regulator [Arthrobacter sp. A2-55]